MLRLIRYTRLFFWLYLVIASLIALITSFSLDKVCITVDIQKALKLVTFIEVVWKEPL